MFSKSFLSAQGLTHVTIGINIASFLLATTKSFDNAYSISDNNSVSAMLVSMFTHLNAEHLVGNMLSLFFTSLSVFADAEWNSPWAFLLIYIPSGLAGFLGNSLIVQMQQKKRERKSPSLTIDSMAQWMANLWNGFDHKNVQERYLLWRRAAAKRVGASGAVYGVVGARIYTAIWSPYHPPLNVNDVKTLLCLIGEELPRSFDMATESMVDHSAHLFGFVTGMVTAWMWDTWLIYRRRKQDSHGSGKRRYIRSGILS
jgi:membrane associated rhomboid family serine protease